MTAKTKRRFGILAAIPVAALAAFGGTVFVHHERAARRYAAAVQQLDRDDPYWRLDDLVTQLHATPLPDAENLAGPLAEARAAQVRPDPDIVQSRAELVVDLVPNVRLSRGQWRAVIDGVEHAEDALLPALELERFPRGRHSIAYTADGISTRFSHVEALSQVRAVLDDLQLAAVQRGEAAAALRIFRTTLNLGRSLREEPAAVSQLARTRYRRAAVRDLERLLGHGELTDAQLADVERELRAELADDQWPVAARGELAFVDRLFRAIRGGDLKPSLLRRLGPVAPPRPTPADRAADWVRDRIGVDLVAEHAEMLEVEARSVAAARLPWPERWAALQALPAAAGPDRSEIVQLLTPNFARLFGHFALDEARVRCALAAVAAERYRLTHGDWPATLAAAGPLPDDPFTGRPLKYKRLADGVAVYSVGPDLADDGGELAEASGSVARPRTDIGVRLWDVPARNRPAR